ncbi:MAG: hypothetical protein Q9196_006691 [Gyalolechia fulgens]
MHAHLTGSITRECLHEIWLERRKEEPDLALEDPLMALPSGATNYDVNTFFPLFTTQIYTLLTTVASLVYSTNSVIASFAADGICYLELRTTPRASPSYTKEAYVTTILDCIATQNDAHKNDMRTSLILSVDRKHDAIEVAEVIDLAIRFKDRGVVGVDLCGNPARGIHVEMLQREFGRAKEAGLGITLHFAEIPESASEAELAGLLAMKPDRLGHVIHVPDAVAEEIAGRRIAVELCLSCNVHAGLTEGGFGGHHFGNWMRRRERGAVVLCVSIFDDVCALHWEGVFLSPLSNEYLVVAEHFNLGREDLLDLCEEAGGVTFGGEHDMKWIRQRIAAFRTEMGVAEEALPV